MNDGEIEAKKQDIIKGFRLNITEYYNALGDLQANNPGFNLDIATDIHPELADYTQQAGHARLKFWKDLYEGLQDNPKYTVVRRYSTQKNTYHSPGTGYGHHLRDNDGMHTSIAHAWLEVYEDLTPEAIHFGYDPVTAATYVAIHADAHTSHTEGSVESTRLFSSDAPDAWSPGGKTITAHSQEPSVFFFSDDISLLMEGGTFKWVEEQSKYLPIDLADDFKASLSERIKTATTTEHSDQDL